MEERISITRRKSCKVVLDRQIAIHSQHVVGARGDMSERFLKKPGNLSLVPETHARSGED